MHGQCELIHPPLALGDHRSREIRSTGTGGNTTSVGSPPYIEILRGRDGRDGLPGPAGRDGKDGEQGLNGGQGLKVRPWPAWSSRCVGIAGSTWHCCPEWGGLHMLGEDHVSEWTANRAGLQWKGCRNSLLPQRRGCQPSLHARQPTVLFS